jgi:hypothetical protein
MALSVFYEGGRKDKYDTYFGAVKTTFRQLTFTLKFIGSVLYFGARAF